MRKWGNRIINIISVLGIALVAVFVILVLHYSEYGKPVVLYVFPFVMFALGTLCFVFTLVFTKKAYNMFFSLVLMQIGIFTVLELIFKFPYTVIQYWPVSGLFAGIAWFFSGLYRYKKVNVGYGIPSIVLFALSFWFMLFSFQIIKIPFKTVVIVLGPVSFIIFVLVAVVIYLYQDKVRKLIAKDEEPEIFEDEELVVTDLDYDDEKRNEIKKEIDDLKFNNILKDQNN